MASPSAAAAPSGALASAVGCVSSPQAANRKSSSSKRFMRLH
jgi:hypothetical protein